ncbi:MAG: class I SAM-dependent methyltransferase [Phycisphaerae bacterium]|nr:class I SAM-dependent methyltransferase [Phycisphaerae bacterium]
MWRRFLKRIQPEGIPWPFSVLYNALSQGPVFRDHYALLVKDIAERRLDGGVLDIGTGPGWLLIKLHEHHPADTLVGVDVCPAMVRVARRNVARMQLAHRIELTIGAAESLPFADASFDTVVSSGSMHHWRDPDAGLREVYRVLHPGGCALLYDFVTDAPNEILRGFAHRHGRLPVAALRLALFEEPFRTTSEFASLGEALPFKREPPRFVGALCCLTLRKPAHAVETRSC